MLAAVPGILPSQAASSVERSHACGRSFSHSSTADRRQPTARLDNWRGGGKSHLSISRHMVVRLRPVRDKDFLRSDDPISHLTWLSTSATKAAGSNLEYTRSAVHAVTGKDQDFSLVWLLFLAVLRNVVNDSHGYDLPMPGIPVRSVSDRVRDFNQIIYSSHLPTEGRKGLSHRPFRRLAPSVPKGCTIGDTKVTPCYKMKSERRPDPIYRRFTPCFGGLLDLYARELDRYL